MGIELEYPDGATPLSEEELDELIPSLSTQGELNEFEAVNIQEATEWIERSKSVKSKLLAPSTVREIHKQMFGRTWKWAGKYRTTEKNIGVDPSQILTQLKQLSDDVACWIEFKSYNSKEICVRFHHRLVSIHPFPKGNGRHARLMTDLLAQQLEIPRPTWGLVVLVHPGQARTQYLRSLEHADQKDYGPLLTFAFS